MSLKDKKILSGGVYRNKANMEFPCTLKWALDEGEVKKLEQERDTLKMIRDRDAHQESREFLVNWLYPPDLIGEDSVYFLNPSGEQLLPSHSNPMCGLVLESGGKNLKEFLRNELLSSVQRIHILQEVVEAVTFLHRLNIVHFDLKPENIVFFTSGDKARWKLIDFDSSCRELKRFSLSPLAI